MQTKTSSKSQSQQTVSRDANREPDVYPQQAHHAAVIQRLQTAPSDLLEMDVIHLQRAIGNRSVVSLLRGERRLLSKTASPGGYAANKEAMDTLMEAGPSRGSPAAIASSGRRGSPSERVTVPAEYRGSTLSEEINVYDDSASHFSAAQLGAYAYSWRGDVFLGPGLGQPGAPSRGEAIQHELVHALQARNTGYASDSYSLEVEAGTGAAHQPRLKADPDQPLGLWFVIPIIAGLYVLLRPNVANAPAPGEQARPSVSELQVGAEAMALFAVPSTVFTALGSVGYGIIASFAISGAASSVAYRGVQDGAANKFSGAEAYVFDAATGALIGIVVGGIFRAFVGAATTTASGSGTQLVHLTSREGQAGIQESGSIIGRQGIYAVPEQVASESVVLRQLRTLLSRQSVARSIPIPGSAQGAFSQPLPVGPVSLYQRLAGVYRAPAGVLDLATGQLLPSGRILANVTGQFWPYGVDAFIWTSAGFVGSTLSPSSSRDYQRGLFSPIYSIVGSGDQPEHSTRSDGPFIFIDPSSPANPQERSGEQQPGGAPQLLASSREHGPLIILAVPMVHGDQLGQSHGRSQEHRPG